MRLQAKTAWGMGVALVLATCVAWAGGEDDECRFQGSAPATSATINHCADFFKTLLLGKGKLDASWKRVEIDSTEFVTGPKGQEWDVMYKNPADPDATKRVLHMIFALNGNVVAVTFGKE